MIAMGWVAVLVGMCLALAGAEALDRVLKARRAARVERKAGHSCSALKGVGTHEEGWAGSGSAGT